MTIDVPLVGAYILLTACAALEIDRYRRKRKGLSELRKPRWTVDVEDADPTLCMWHRVTQGRSRFRAVCVLLICSFARPRDVHRLYWQTELKAQL